MSSMLEQAIVDAEALRETAINSAEAQIIEKYSDNLPSQDSFKFFSTLKSCRFQSFFCQKYI